MNVFLNTLKFLKTKNQEMKQNKKIKIEDCKFNKSS